MDCASNSPTRVPRDADAPSPLSASQTFPHISGESPSVREPILHLRSNGPSGTPVPTKLWLSDDLPLFFKLLLIFYICRDIIILPDKLNISLWGIFSFWDSYTFFDYTLIIEFDKMQIPYGKSMAIPFCI